MKLTLLMAMTADGKIARDKDHFPNWTGKADKRMFKKITTEAGVVIMGSRTFRTIGKPLPGRLNVVMTRHPERFDPSENVVFSTDPPEILMKKLAAQGYKSAVLAGGATINTLFVRARLINEMVVTVIPKMFGQGISMFCETMDLSLELIERREIEPGVLVLHYRFLS